MVLIKGIFNALGAPPFVWEALFKDADRQPAPPEELARVRRFADYRRSCEMRSSGDFLDRIADQMALERRRSLEMMPELQRRLEDDFKSITVLRMPQWQAQLYNCERPFGDEVWNAFTAAREDIQEASNCLATDRGTACVFHLMRAIESPLLVLKRRFRCKDKSDNWDGIIRGIDSALKQTAFKTKRKPWWWKDREYWGEVSNRLHALKLSRRNPTVHLRSHERFTAPQAALVFTDVRAFMRHLAPKFKSRAT